MAPRSDALFGTIEAVHAAGLDETLWPQALGKIAASVGGPAATIEVFDKLGLRPREIYTQGIPPLAEIKYLDQYVALNRRLPVVARDKLGQLSWDYRIFDDRTIKRDPFYMEFLRGLGLCYFVGGIIATDSEEFAGVCVHFSPRQGHVDKAGIALMRRLLPHVRSAFDVARRLRPSLEARQSLERALDWLTDGAVLVAADGKITFANEAFQAIARRSDGIGFKRGAIDIAAAAPIRARLDQAIAASARWRAGVPSEAEGLDFSVPRPSGDRPYLISVRPLLEKSRIGSTTAPAVAIVFVHDPIKRATYDPSLMREIFGFTSAEANLAAGLQAGLSLGDYARHHALSLNTIYAHLRRIKDKTGCRKVPELIRRLNDLTLPSRSWRP
jgi:DNA-binding CsgD family transcriptional regulator/PAS domain-containing protein